MPSLPLQLLQSLKGLDHFDEKAFIEAHSEENKLNSIRLNPFKKTELDFDLAEPVKWNTEGYYLAKRPYFTHDPLFQAGCYYPQEAGSMFLEFALRQSLEVSKPLKILDVCAAPGGKSTLLNSLINEDSLLVANELIKSRAEVLAQNLGKWGTSNTLVTNNDPRAFSDLHSFFDAIIVDAPCSGSGLFRKQPEAIAEWSEAHVKTCSIRQQKILEDVLPSLKPGGILVYSTCSYSLAENEDIVARLVNEKGMEYLPLPIDKTWGIVETSDGYRFYPHLTKSEGFFCAVLRKTDDSSGTVIPKRKNNANVEVTKTEAELLQTFVRSLNQYLIKRNGRFHLVNKEVHIFLNAFEGRFYLKKAGVSLGEIKGKDLVPDHELALYPGVNPNLNHIDMDKETALKFLKKESFSIPQKMQGLALIRYKSQGLGWAKILPNRINNYLPNELRILK